MTEIHDRKQQKMLGIYAGFASWCREIPYLQETISKIVKKER